MKFPKSCKVIMYFNRFFEITQFQNESQKSFLWLNFLMSHKRLVFHEKNFFQEVIHPQIFFVIYLYLDASAKRIFKQKNSLADLMHSHISKSDHSAEAALLKVFVNLLNKERTSENFKKFGKYFISILHCIFVVRSYSIAIKYEFLFHVWVRSSLSQNQSSSSKKNSWKISNNRTI